MKRWSQPDYSRIQATMNNYQVPGNGQVVTWRHYTSASAASVSGSFMGLGDEPTYTERQITAFMGQFFQPGIPQTQSMGGGIVAGEFKMVSRERLYADDEIIWNGSAYRVDGESVPAKINSTYTTIIKRATP